MENIVAIGIVFVILCGLLWIAKRFLKPIKGPLPDCCSGSGNKNSKLSQFQNRNYLTTTSTKDTKQMIFLVWFVSFVVKLFILELPQL
jgi:hypothetical protein